MAGDGTDGKKRRAESRERRRAQAGGSQPTSERADGGEALQAARAAATAAAVGAAVGAVRALTGRRGDEADDVLAEAERTLGVEDAPPEPDESEQQPPEPEAAEQPPSDEEAEQPQPAATREERPAHGASPDEAARIARRAREHLRDLHGSEPESVSALERRADGWFVTLEVVELRRVPDSTDLLATYHVELDPDGDLLGFKRGGRYYRAQADSRGGQA